MNQLLTLNTLPGTFVICRCAPDTPIPAWAGISAPGAFVSVTRTADELSIVCPDASLPPDVDREQVKAEPGWACLKVAGPLDFGMTGILAGLTSILAPVGITVFSVSTYDTDYLFVRHESLERAVRVLRHAGHTVVG